MNPYEVLGIEKDASLEEVTKTYRKLVMQHHPDRGGDEMKFKEITAAYEKITSPSKSPEVPFDMFFRDFFQNSPRKQSGKNNILNVEITLEEMLIGKEIDIKHKQKISCAACEGEGSQKVICHHCNGTGMRTFRNSFTQMQQTCDICGGFGFKKGAYCTTCSGKGYSGEEDEKTLKLNIPPGGIKAGGQMVFRGCGEPGKNGGSAGHLIVSITIKPHELFSILDNNDLLLKVPVSFPQLVLGDDLEVIALDGQNLNLKIPHESGPNRRLRLKGHGLPKNHDPKVRGDLFVELVLEIPKVDSKITILIEKMMKFNIDEKIYPEKKQFASLNKKG